MSKEDKKELEELKSLLYTSTLTQYGKRKLIYLYENLIEKQDKIINKAIKEIEILRQYFDESSQGDFIRILEILKDKNVIDW